jgi:hypothetical protein
MLTDSLLFVNWPQRKIFQSHTFSIHRLPKPRITEQCKIHNMASIPFSMMKDPTGKPSIGYFDSQYPHLLYFGKI